MGAEDPLAGLRAARASDDLLAVSQTARQILSEGRPLGGIWGEVASTALEAGDDIAAKAAAEKLIEAMPRHSASWLWLASAESALGRHGAALSIVKRQLMGAPEDASLHRRAGRYCLELGDLAGAEAAFRQAIALDPTEASAWAGLADAKTFSAGDDDLAAMEEIRINADDRAGAEQRGVIAYALAKAYEDLGDYDIAARRVAEGAAFIRAAGPFDVARHVQGVAQILRTYDEAFIAAHEEAGLIDPRPVFLIAPPGTGADWLADALSAGAGVKRLTRHNALFWLACAPLGDHTRREIDRALARPGAEPPLTQVGRAYTDYVDEHINGAKRWIDPSTLAELAGGAAGVALPAARFIVLRREIKDLAWSIYKRRFRRGRAWSYHPEDIARVLDTHYRLTERWAQLFPDRVLIADYEDLVGNPEDELRRIAFFIRVDAEAAVAEAWTGGRAFERDPIGVHERAGARFTPLAAALERAGLL